jgi:hypothetical protein
VITGTQMITRLVEFGKLTKNNIKEFLYKCLEEASKEAMINLTTKNARVCAWMELPNG